VYVRYARIVFLQFCMRYEVWGVRVRYGVSIEEFSRGFEAWAECIFSTLEPGGVCVTIEVVLDVRSVGRSSGSAMHILGVVFRRFAVDWR